MKAVIAPFQEKGGTGKTTYAVNVACGLAARGYRVLLVDADPQGHATSALGVAKYPGLYDFLVRNAPQGDVLRTISPQVYDGDDGDGFLAGQLVVLGGNVETRNIANSISDAWSLAVRLQQLAPSFDVCLIDTAPTPSLLHGVIYLATDYVVYPTLCESWSLDGLAESVQRLRDVRAVKKIRMAGVIPMRYRANTLEHSDRLRALVEQFGDLVWPPVPDRIVVAEATSFQRPVHVHAPDSDAAGHMWELVDRTEALLNGK